ncbi:protein lin-54 homolog isoform X2 [Hyalella azteca]|uniref:Protein lin-54 homolog isoform X2 n=1 Tax=Hyalella azteca TaxID=294128 RepID=A0A979FQ36_HYAAZ|nr:protein lin-54 homolog isoform X2 [Hyalella azteca]
MPQNNPGNMIMVSKSCGDGGATVDNSSTNLMLDANPFGGELNEQELGSLVELDYHTTSSSNSSVLLPQDQLLDDSVDGSSSLTRPMMPLQHPSEGDMESMFSTIEDQEALCHSSPPSASLSFTSEQPSLIFTLASTAPSFTSCSSPNNITHTTNYISSPTAPQSSPLPKTNSSSVNVTSYFHDSLEDDESSIGDISSYSDVMTEPQKQPHIIPATDGGGSSFQLVGLANASVDNSCLDSLGVTTMMVDEQPLTGSSLPPSLGFGDHAGVKPQEGAAAGVALKSIDLSNFQLVRTSTGPILVKQMQNSNKVISKVVINNTSSSSTHQQIRLLPATSSTRTIILSGTGAGGSSARTTMAAVASKDTLGPPPPSTTKLTLQQAQKLGLISPSKLVQQSPTKIVMKQVGGSSNNISSSRIVLAPGGGSTPHPLLLKSTPKISPAQPQVSRDCGTVKILPPPKPGAQVQKIFIRNPSEAGDGRALQQPIIRVASSAVVSAPSIVLNNNNNKDSAKTVGIRLMSPISSHKPIAPVPSQQIKIRPISIAPNNQIINKPQQQQQCVIIPVSGQKQNVVMIPLQYLSQLQSSAPAPSSAPIIVNTSAPSVAPPTPSPSTAPQSKPPPPPKTLIDANGIKSRKPCNCNKSQCLKLYCDCFANGEFCNNCNCSNCYNNLNHEEERQKAIKLCLDRNPSAFKPKIGKGGTSTERRHNKGCNCKRSGCLKNYCECYEAKIPCSNMCKCYGCKNVDNATLLERRKLMQLPPDPSTIMSSAAPAHSLTSSIMDSLGSIGSTSSLISSCSTHAEPESTGSSGFSSGGSFSSTNSGSFSRNNSTSSNNHGGSNALKNFPVTVPSASPSKFGALKGVGSSRGPSPPCGAVSYRISQEVVSATCGCILATAARSQKQGLERRQTEAAIIKEFHNCIQHIIQGCMTSQARAKGN